MDQVNSRHIVVVATGLKATTRMVIRIFSTLASLSLLDKMEIIVAWAMLSVALPGRIATLPALLLILYVPKVGDYRERMEMDHTNHWQ